MWRTQTHIEEKIPISRPVEFFAMICYDRSDSNYIFGYDSVIHDDKRDWRLPCSAAIISICIFITKRSVRSFDNKLISSENGVNKDLDRFRKRNEIR